MIKLAKKHTFGNWVDMGDGVSFQIDYPTATQQQELDGLMIKMGSCDPEKPNEVMLEYARLFIRYTVKDWKGIDEKCELTNNMLKKELWERLTTDPQNSYEMIAQSINMWVKISAELEFTDVDKKK